MNGITDDDRAKINAAMDKISGQLIYLYGRWQDEKEYEDFNDYKTAIESYMKENLPEFHYVGMTKRPFAPKFHFNGFKGSFSINARHISWKITGRAA